MAEKKFIVDKSRTSMKSEDMIDKIVELCEEIMFEPLNDENELEFSKELEYSLNTEYSGYFRCYFGST